MIGSRAATCLDVHATEATCGQCVGLQLELHWSVWSAIAEATSQKYTASLVQFL